MKPNTWGSREAWVSDSLLHQLAGTPGSLCPGMCCSGGAASDSLGEIPRTPALASKPLGGLPAEPRAARKQRPQVTSLGTLTPRSPWTPALWSGRSLVFVFPSCSLRSGAENWSTGTLRPPGVAHWLRTGLQSACRRLRASSPPRSKGRPQSWGLTLLSLAGGRVMGTGWPPTSRPKQGRSHLGETARDPGSRVPRPSTAGSALEAVSAGLGACWSPWETESETPAPPWPGLGPMPCVVRLVCLSAEVLMGRGLGTAGLGPV